MYETVNNRELSRPVGIGGLGVSPRFKFDPLPGKSLSCPMAFHLSDSDISFGEPSRRKGGQEDGSKGC